MIFPFDGFIRQAGALQTKLDRPFHKLEPSFSLILTFINDQKK